MEFEEAVSLFFRDHRRRAAAGADFVQIETMSDTRAQAAVLAARKAAICPCAPP
jgi:methionine synthase I (cobalamin-dependent)